jgi:hypothetical protein
MRGSCTVASLTTDLSVSRLRQDDEHILMAAGAGSATCVRDWLVPDFRERVAAVVAVLPKRRRDDFGPHNSEDHDSRKKNGSEPDQVSRLFHGGLLC